MKTLGACGIALALSLQSALAAEPAGVWLAGQKDAHIQIEPCANGRDWCGKVVWLAEPIDIETGKPLLDKLNENPALRHRPIVGVQILIDMKWKATSQWAGRIYNARENGKTYVGQMTLIDEDTLYVEGCIPVLTINFCQNESWIRVR